MAPEGRKVYRLAKAAGAEPCGQMRDERVHAVVARSTFPSQNVQSTPTSEHFWKLRRRKSACRWGEANLEVKMYKAHQSVSDRFWKLTCRKSARRCHPKHISKSKVLTVSEHSWKLRCRKGVRRCGAKHISKSKV